MAEWIIQRVVMPPRRGLTRLYYRFRGNSPPPREKDRRGLVLPRGTVVRADTWFNAFFESYWREYTNLAMLVLQLRLCGEGTIRLYRRSCENEQHLLREIGFSERDRELRVEIGEPSSERFGMLFFEIEAHSSQVRMHQAAWSVRAAAARPTRLVAGFCTFNRPTWLLRNVADLLADPDVAALLESIVVVDQGEEKVRDQDGYAALARAAGGRLLLVEQENRGGAGGFTRCLLEAQRIGGATHILLMDDDILVEPESVLRAAAFLSLARGNLAVGGHMLDRSRPRQLVETGSRFLPEQVRIDEPSRQRLDRVRDLSPFLQPQPRHYNGWWFCAFPLSVLERAGLPLPLFLRGDDLEFGCRLLRHGVPTVALPGVAVWHEPFERKGRGWHSFLELRNYLIAGALHFSTVRAATVARRIFSRMLDELLAYDYYEAWLMCEAVAAYLRGPEALCQSPHALHQHLQKMAQKLASQLQEREERGPTKIDASSLITHHSSLATLRSWRWRLVLRNLLRTSPSPETRPQRVLQGSGEQWYNVACADVVGVDQPRQQHMIVLRRSRSRFVRLFIRSLWLALCLLGGHRRAVRRWKSSMATLASRTCWTEHLHLPALLHPPSESRPFGSGSLHRSRTVATQTAE